MANENKYSFAFKQLQVFAGLQVTGDQPVDHGFQ